MFEHSYRLRTRRALALAMCAAWFALLAGVAAPAADASLQDSLYTPVSGSPFPSDGNPYAVAFDPVGGYVADVNYEAGNISIYSIDPASGGLTEVGGSSGGSSSVGGSSGPTGTPGVTASPFPTGTGPVSLAFSPNGALLATANLVDGTVSVFSVNQTTGVLTEVAGSPFTTGNEPYSVAFSPDGSLLATANFADGTVSVFSVNLSTGGLQPVSGSPFTTGASPRSVSFSPAGLLATANGDNSVSVFSIDPSSDALTPVAGSPFPDGGEPYSVAFSPDGHLLATANAQANELALFTVGGSGSLATAPGSPFATDSDPVSVVFSPNGAYVGTTNYVGDDVSMFDVNSKADTLTPAPGSPIAAGIHPHGAAFSSDYQNFAVANAGDGTVSQYLFNLPVVQITYPAAGSTFAVGQRVEATYTCTDGPYGAGISICADDRGGSGGTGILDTATEGVHTYTVTAGSFDGLSGSSSITYNVVLEAPTNIDRPSVHGKDLPGHVLQCMPGKWTGDPTSFTYQWRRAGAQIARAARASYKLAPVDADSSVSCTVTASNRVGRSGASASSGVFIKAPGTRGCPAASGTLNSQTLGLIKLGMTRAGARRTYRRSTLKHTAYTDSFCVAPTGITVGYPTPRALRAVSPALRRKLAGRVVWALTTNPYYALGAIKPGTRLRDVRAQLTHAVAVRSGRDPWYLLSQGRATGLVQFQGGTARWVGIATSQLTAKASARRQFLATLP